MQFPAASAFGALAAGDLPPGFADKKALSEGNLLQGEVKLRKRKPTLCQRRTEFWSPAEPAFLAPTSASDSSRKGMT
jgi:hypothetical protein